MNTRFIKTEAGFHEIRAPKFHLPRQQRNLLLVLNDTESIEFWMSNIHRVQQSDIVELLEMGLIEPAPIKVNLDIIKDQKVAAVLASVESISFSTLYEALVKFAYLYYGQDKGYQFELEIQNCETLDDLRKVAVETVMEAAMANEFQLLKKFSADLVANRK